MKATAGLLCRTTPEMREKANAAALKLGIPIAEYLRMAVLHLVEEGTNPFEKHSGIRAGRPATYLPRQ